LADRAVGIELSGLMKRSVIGGESMTKLIVMGAMAATALLMTSIAATAAKPVYFHKPDVNRETFVADFSECNELAGGVRAPQYNVYSPNMYAMAAASFFAPFFEGSARRGLVNNVLRTCMADKGYRRVEATPELRKELKRLAERERVDRLFLLASSPQPIGKVLPK
jgi:hypothetical protein